jgi:uncharacterized circularly permuted ATP-grasp superfamily protein
MVDGKGGLRPQWRSLLGVLAGLGHSVLAERGRRLHRVMEEEGAASLLPGSPPDPWRFDPIPLPLPQSEFEALEVGLAQRARLLDAVLADLYGPQRLLADGVVPPALVYANPAFLRPCRHAANDDLGAQLQFYSADLVRTSDGTWNVLADHTGLADGLAHALQNRRRLGRVVPELFVSQPPCHLDPFVELCLDMLRRIAPTGAAALLTPGHADPAWYGHVLLARELSCTLVEGGDLTVRDGGLFLKTLRGLQPISVLLRGVPGGVVDPLELDSDGSGVPGLLAAARDRVHIVNRPGSGLAEAPAFAAFLPELATRLLGEALCLPSVPTVWLQDPELRALVLSGPEEWCLRSALDGASPPVLLAAMAGPERHALLERIDATPWRFAASRIIAPSVAPCLERGSWCRACRRAGGARRRSALRPRGREGAAVCCRMGRKHGQIPDRCLPRMSGCRWKIRLPSRDRSRPGRRRWRSAARQATCPAVWPTTTSGSGATSSGWRVRPGCCASRSAASADRRRRRTRRPNWMC